MKGQKLSVGDKVSVLVKSVDIDKKRLDLELCTDSDVKQEPQSPSSRKAQIQPRLFADLKVNQELAGCITSITAFGAFVDVGVGKDGLLHISKMAGQNLNIGDSITVFVQNIDFDKKQLQLNLCTNLKFNQQSSANIKNEQLKPMPFTDLRINQELTGVVKNIAPYGAFVDIGVGSNGLIHISRMRGKELNIGDIVSVVVKSVDFEKKRIELEFCTEYKVKTEPNNFNNLKKEQSKSHQFTDLRVNEELTGFVRNVTMYGAFVDVGVGSNGLIHVSKMKGQQLQVGEKVSVRLRSIDYQRKRLE
ncbi:30S ribosomal protein S1, partial [Stegodyphus mimosarum]